MYSLTHDLWSSMIDAVIDAHSYLFEAMHSAAANIKLSSSLVEELKLKGFKEVDKAPWKFLLKIELFDDKIGGFMIYLLAAEEPEVYESIKAEAAAAYGASLEDVRGFEIENGLNMDEDVIEKIDDEQGISAAKASNEVLFKLVVFDSQDIDNSRGQGNMVQRFPL